MIHEEGRGQFKTGRRRHMYRTSRYDNPSNPRSETGRGHSSPLQARSSEVAAPSPRSSPRNGSYLASSRLRGVQHETGGLQIRRSQPAAQSANVQQPSRASHPVEPVQVLLCPRRTPQTPRSRGRQFVARCSPVDAAALAVVTCVLAVCRLPAGGLVQPLGAVNNILELNELRRGVGLCIYRRDGLVFAARRLDDPQRSWQMPQVGGCDISVVLATLLAFCLQCSCPASPACTAGLPAISTLCLSVVVPLHHPNPSPCSFACCFDPQGGIDPEEDPREAALRELYEETGIKRCRIVASIVRWLQYSFPTKVKAQLPGSFLRYRGQAQVSAAAAVVGCACALPVPQLLG